MESDRIAAELTHAIAGEREWRRHMQTLDSGSYREDASPEWVAAKNVGFAYKQLADALLAFERDGYEPPKGAPDA